MAKKPIHRAIAEALQANGAPMTAREIFEQIEEGGLYSFKARNPFNVLKSQLRRHCKEWDFPSARITKYFTMTRDGHFALLEKPVRIESSLFKLGSKTPKSARVVSVPSNEDDDTSGSPERAGPSHSEIQWRLLDLGAQMGLSVWAPKSDRGKLYDGHLLGDVSRLLNRLPPQFDTATTKTIENIDVLWLERRAIIAGFEVEHTTSIYSGLLRMSDLLTMQPNMDIQLYLVAPDERFTKFAREIARPTFSHRRKPLHTLCRFLSYTSLLEKLEEAKNLLRHLRPEFLDDIAESYDPAAELDA